MLSVVTTRSIAATLRGPSPLADTLAAAASELRAALGADGVALVVRREGRAIRGQAGTLDDDPRAISLSDPGVDADATLLVSGNAPVSDDVALVLSLALTARFLAESAQTDGLTGVANRRTFDTRLREEWLRAARDRTPLAVAILDIDYFKIYNDRRGHPAGDDALRRVAHAASASLQRAGDRFARYGGEEFAVILPATSLAGGIAAAERIRAAVTALAIAHPVGKAGRLTVSAGVAATIPAHEQSADALLAAADRELYRAKAEGRDRVAAGGYISDDEPDAALPQPFSALVGRDDDVDAVDVAIDRNRVVTITGQAGVGKTRLAIAVAHQAAERFSHVRFVDALGAANRDEVLARVGATLGVVNPDDVPAALVNAGPTLIVLDGCERVAEACRAVADTLTAIGESDRDTAAAPTGVHVLATSRVPLGARDERVVRLNPLGTRATRALFANRAAAAGIVADPDDHDVSALLRRLAGSPFAVELAVNRLGTTSAASVLRTFTTTSAGTGDAARANDADDAFADRASLGSLLSSAVAALDPHAATALAAVATFRGSFSASDAATVIPLDGIDARRADELLRAMTARSLLDAASHGGVTRWRMIDPVRDVADALPFAADVRCSADAAHIGWCLRRLDAITVRAGTGTNRAALAESETVIDEVRAALDRTLLDDALVARGAELCTAAVRQWFAIRHSREGRERCEAFLDRSALLDARTRATLHASAARLAYLEGDLPGTDNHARAADALLGDGDVIERSPVLNYLGIAAKFHGDYDAAERYFQAGRALNARLGSRRGEAIAIGALGTMAFDIRLDHDEAVARFREAAATFRDLGEDLNALVMEGNLAESLAARGDVAAAEPIVTAALEESRAFANRATTGQLACVAALVHELQNDLPAAAGAMREVLTATAIAPGPLVTMALDFSARIAHRAGDDALAAQLIAHAETYTAAHAMPLLPIQRFWREPVVTAARENLGERAYEHETARGRAMSESEVFAKLDAFVARQIV
jgi:diguanylate cyclase (GGDEF)-like protein